MGSSFCCFEQLLVLISLQRAARYQAIRHLPRYGHGAIRLEAENFADHFAQHLNLQREKAMEQRGKDFIMTETAARQQINAILLVTQNRLIHALTDD